MFLQFSIKTEIKQLRYPLIYFMQQISTLWFIYSRFERLSLLPDPIRSRGT